MKIYGIEYQYIDGIYFYYIITCKFLSVRKTIEKSFYEQLKENFNLADKNNSSLSGRYYSSKEI